MKIVFIILFFWFSSENIELYAESVGIRVVCAQIIYLKKTPEEAYKPLVAGANPPFLPFRSEHVCIFFTRFAYVCLLFSHSFFFFFFFWGGGGGRFFVFEQLILLQYYLLAVLISMNAYTYDKHVFVQIFNTVPHSLWIWLVAWQLSHVVLYSTFVHSTTCVPMSEYHMCTHVRVSYINIIIITLI